MPSWTPRRISRLVQDVDLASTLLDAAAASRGPATSAQTARRHLDRLFREALDAVGQDVEAHPDRDLLLTLIRDDHGLGDEGVARCLELIYSHMINRFKGDLTEILALGSLGQELGRLRATGRVPAAARWISGGEVLERQSRRGAWAKGADGLLAATGREHRAWERARAGGGRRPGARDLVLYGLAEIKSYAVPERRVVAQLGKHWERLRRGVRIGGREWAPERIFVGGGDGVAVGIVEAGARTALSFLVTPARAGKVAEEGARPLGSSDSALVRLTVPFSRLRIMSAAYCMTEWFCSRLGERAFGESGSPIAEMTAAQAGFNRIKETLYHVQLRDYRGLKEHRTDLSRWRRRRQRLDRIASRLYNAYGWSLEEAVEHRKMMWPSTAEVLQ